MHLPTPVKDVVAASREVASNGRGRILFAVGLGWFLLLGIRMTFPVLLPSLRAEFGLNLATAGLLLTLLSGVYAVAQLPAGLVGDKFGERRILAGGILFVPFALAGIATATSTLVLVVGMVGFALGLALFGPGRFTLVSRLYAHRSGSAIGLIMSAGSAGNTLLPIMAVSIATAATWRLSLGVFVPFLFVVGIGLWVTLPQDASPTPVPEVSSERTTRRLVTGFRTGSVPVAAAIQVLASFVYQGFTGFYPTYLVEIKHVTPWEATLLFSVFFGVSILSQPLAGIGNDRLGPNKTLFGLFAVTAFAFWTLPFVTNVWQLVALTVLLSSLAGCPVVTQLYITRSLPDDIQGTGLGMVRSGFMVIGATSTFFIGAFADVGYFDEAFLGLAALTTLAMSVSVFVRTL